MTLLIDETDTDLKPGDIKQVYPFPFELVDKSKIDEALLNADPKYVFAIAIPVDNASFKFQLLSAGDLSEFLAYIDASIFNGSKKKFIIDDFEGDC